MSATQTIVSVPEMHCAGCARGIEGALADVPGIERLAIDATRRRVIISHDAGVVAPAELLGALQAVQPSAVLADVTAARAPAGQVTRLAVAGVLGMQVMMLALAMYGGGMAADIEHLLRLASLLLSLPIVFYAAQPFFFGAFRALSRRTLSMDVPVATAIAVTFAASTAATLRPGANAPVYYDSVAMFVFLLLLARFLADRLRANFESEVSLADLLPVDCLRIEASGNRRVPIESVQPGDRLRIGRGESIPMDGRVVGGSAWVDESVLTGESRPVLRTLGERVFAATTSVGGSFEMEVTAARCDARFRRIAELAEGTSPTTPLLSLADRIAGVFVAAVMAIATMTFAVWQWIDPAMALSVSVAVLVVACPCALSLAAPAALTAALVRLRRAGVVITRAGALEQLAGLRSILFDKTGTLTRSRPRVDAVEVFADLAPDRCLAIAAALEHDAQHPYARAFETIEAVPAADVEELPGQGVIGRVAERRYRLGSAAFCGLLGEAEHGRVWLATDEGKPLAAFHVTGELRPAALQTLEALAGRKLHLALASGDGQAQCARFAPWLEVHARQRPEDKLTLLERLPQPTLVVGDGINDLPAMAGATVSATFVDSRALVRARADVLLLGERLDALLELLDAAQRCRRVQRQNLVWAGAWNGLAIPAAAAGLLAPWAAALGMATSSLVVIANAVRTAKAPERRQQRRAALEALA